MNEVIPDKSTKKIKLMFDEIAPTYDKLNHLFTLKLDVKWRKEIINTLRKDHVHKDKILDLASGTGDLTIQLLKLNPVEIIAADFSEKMLELQRRKIPDERLKLIVADAVDLPFDENYFDIITIGFGIRNFEKLEESLKEICRVLKPNGVLVIIEMFNAQNFVNKIFDIYFGKLMPFVGNKISRSNYAYDYLFQSVKSFYDVRKFTSVCEMNGLNVRKIKNNFLGVVNTVYLGKRIT